MTLGATNATFLNQGYLGTVGGCAFCGGKSSATSAEAPRDHSVFGHRNWTLGLPRINYLECKG